MPTTPRQTGSLPRRRRSNPNPNPNPDPDPDPNPDPSPKPKSKPNPKPNLNPKPNRKPNPNQAIPENITVLRRKVSCPGASDKHEPRFLEDCGKRRRAVVKGGGGVVGAGKGAERKGKTGQPAKVSRRRKKLSETPASRTSRVANSSS